jgi:hypothetical protein
MLALPLALTTLALAAGPAPEAEAPRAAARAYFEALVAGDAERALALVDAPSDADRMVVRASAAMERGLARLEDVAVSRFGERGHLGLPAHQRRFLAAVDAATVEITGERAAVRPEGGKPVFLRRAGGAWKVLSPAERLTGEERKALEEALARTEAATKDVAERIRAGAVKSAREARDALMKALGHPEEEGVPL